MHSTISKNDIVNNWEFVDETPAGGQAYFSLEKDMSAII